MNRSIEFDLYTVIEANARFASRFGAMAKADRAKTQRATVRGVLSQYLMRPALHVVKTKSGFHPVGSAVGVTVPNRIEVRITRIAPGETADAWENLRSSMKAVKDEIAAWVGCDDKEGRGITWLEPGQERGPQRVYRCRIEIFDLLSKPDQKVVLAETASAGRAAESRVKSAIKKAVKGVHVTKSSDRRKLAYSPADNAKQASSKARQNAELAFAKLSPKPSPAAPARAHDWHPQVPGKVDYWGCTVCGGEREDRLQNGNTESLYRLPTATAWSSVVPVCTPAANRFIPTNAENGCRARRVHSAEGHERRTLQKGERCAGGGYGSSVSEGVRMSMDLIAFDKLQSKPPKAERSKEIGEETAARNVAECPSCNAAIGAPCDRSVPGAFTFGVHLSRAQKAGIVSIKVKKPGAPPCDCGGITGVHPVGSHGCKVEVSAGARRVVPLPSERVLKAFVRLPWAPKKLTRYSALDGADPKGTIRIRHPDPQIGQSFEFYRSRATVPGVGEAWVYSTQ